MTKSARRQLLRSVSLPAISAVSLLNLTSLAAAEIPAPPVRQRIDNFGSDLISGRFSTSASDISIGSAEHGLSYARYWTDNQWRDSATITLSGSTQQPIVTIGNQSFAFTNTQNGYVSQAGNGSTLVAQTYNRFVYTTPDGTEYRFALGGGTGYQVSNLGNVVAIKKPDGSFVYFSYKGYSYPVTYRQNGRTYTSTKNGSRIQSIYNSYGYMLKFSYERNDQPTEGAFEYEQTYKWSDVRSIAAINRAIDICDPSADVCSLTASWPTATYSIPLRDSTGRRFSNVTNAAGVSTIYTYNSNGRMLTARNPALASNSIEVEYPTDGVVGEYVQIDGVKNHYIRSLSGDTMTTLVTRIGGGTSEYKSTYSLSRIDSYQDEVGNITRYDYDGSQRLTSITLPEQNSVAFSYDGRGNRVTTTHNPKPGSGLTAISTSAAYPAACDNATVCNKPTSITDELGRVTNYTYDSTHGGVTKIERPLVGGVRPTRTFGYYPHQAYIKPAGPGAPVSTGQSIWLLVGSSDCRTAAECLNTADESRITLWRGSQDGSTVNNLNVLVASNGSGVSAGEQTSSFGYDIYGNMIVTDGPRGDVDDRVYRRFDINQRLVGIVEPDPDGAGPALRKAQRLSYDAVGQLTKTEVGTINGSGESDWTSFLIKQSVETSYDGYGRSVSERVIAEGGGIVSASQQSYDSAGRVSCVAQRMNPANYGSLPADACSLTTSGTFGPDRIIRTAYDAAGRIQEQWGGEGLSEGRRLIRYDYTSNGKASSVYDALNRRTGYTYDGFDRLVKTNYYGGGSTTDYDELTLDAAGNVRQRRLRNGSYFAIGYDELNRPTLISMVAGRNNANRTFSYDLHGNLLNAAVRRPGHTAQTDMTYDALDRVVTETSYLNGGNAKTKTSSYNAAGLRTGLQLPDGLSFNYTYDAAGQMKTIGENGGAAMVAFDYDDLGRLFTKHYANGTRQNYRYDGISRLRYLTTEDGPNATAVCFGPIANGLFSNATCSGSYNPAGQITSKVSSSDAYTWAGTTIYDRAYQTNGLNQYINVGGVGMGYDGSGNLTGSGNASFVYDDFNQLTQYSAAPGSPTHELLYDALGRLVWSSEEGRRFDYDGMQLVGEYDSASGLLNRFMHGPGTDNAIMWYPGGNLADRRFLEADERGSIVRILDSNRGLIATNTYDPYGVPGSANQGRFQYTGQAWLPGVGLYYYKARMYSPTLGRFMQTDPIGYGDGINWYNYTGGDPVNMKDPEGLAGCTNSPRYTSCLDHNVQLPSQSGGGGGNGGNGGFNILGILKGVFGFGSQKPKIVKPIERDYRIPTQDEIADRQERACATDPVILEALSKPFVKSALEDARGKAARTGNEYGFEYGQSIFGGTDITSTYSGTSGSIDIQSHFWSMLQGIFRRTIQFHIHPEPTGRGLSDGIPSDLFAVRSGWYVMAMTEGGRRYCGIPRK